MNIQVTVLDHSLVRHHLTGVRNRETPSSAFRQHIRVLATLLAAEATRQLPLRTVDVETPIERTQGSSVSARIVAVPILRAGLAMVEPFTELFPATEVRHLGLYRDESTATPVHYYDRLPNNNPPDIAMILDPMLATGGSAVLAVETLKRWGVPQILMLTIISAPEGIAHLNRMFPDVRILTCAVDRTLNARKYIVPGLGDAGDRIFGTE